jgi:hypothetical protein
MIDQELQQFIEGPVMLIVGSVGADRRCAIGRASGARVTGGVLEILVSRWQWPDTIDNLLANPAMSLTVASPVDYTCFQLKGASALRPAGDADLALAERYIDATYQLMTTLGIPANSASAWFSDRELWTVTLNVADVFIQTPGPQAGQRRPAP